MKRPSSGLGVGLWSVGGLIALYLLGFGLLWIDGEVTRTGLYHRLPPGPQAFIHAIYSPLVLLLYRLGFFS